MVRSNDSTEARDRANAALNDLLGEGEDSAASLPLDPTDSHRTDSTRDNSNRVSRNSSESSLQSDTRHRDLRWSPRASLHRRPDFNGQPAEKYPDALTFDFKGKTRLHGVRMPLFRNNLIASSKAWDLLFVAIMADIYVYEYNPLTQVPEEHPVLIVNTRPERTEPRHILGANWRSDPHGINHVRLCEYQPGEEALVTAGDDGRVLIYTTKRLMMAVEFNKRNHLTGIDMARRRVSPDEEYEFEASVWGMDISPHDSMMAVSDNSRKVTLQVIGAARMNASQYVEPGEEVLRMESPVLEHNIPEVEFVKVDERERKQGTVYVACISISGETAMWEFYYGKTLAQFKHDNRRQHAKRERLSSLALYVDSGDDSRDIGDTSGYDEPHETGETGEPSEPSRALISDESDEPSGSLTIRRPRAVGDRTGSSGFDVFAGNTDQRDSQDVTDAEMFSDDDREEEPIVWRRTSIESSNCYMEPFEYGRWWYCEQLNQDGWSINYLPESYFKQVDSFFGATGNKWLNEDAIFAYYCKQSAELVGRDHSNPAEPYVRFSMHDIETKVVQSFQHTPWSSVAQDGHYTLPLCQRKDQKMEKYLKDRKGDRDKLLNPPFKNQFFVCTTKKSLYLCRVEDLYCNGARSNVFNWESVMDPNETHFDRMSIVQVIPDLSAVLVASQVGIVSVFRLTRYRGVFCMRQEYTFPKVEQSYADLGAQVIAGLSVSPVKHHGSRLHAQLSNNESYDTYRICLLRANGSILTYFLSRDHDMSLDSVVI